MTQKSKGRTGLKTLSQVGAFRIVVRPDSPGSYQVVGPRLPGEERRTRKSYKSEDEARAKAVEYDELVKKRRLAKQATDARMALVRLTPTQLREAEALFDLVGRDPRVGGRSLSEIVQAGLGAPVVRKKPLGDLIDEFLERKRQENVEPRTMQSLESALGQYRTQAKDLTVDSVRAFVFARGYKEGGKVVEYSPTTRRNRRTQIGQLVRWAFAEGYLPEDFMGRIKAPRIGDEVGEIATLSPAESRALFEAAREIAGGKLAPYVILCIWAGVRPGEMETLRPDQIDLERGVVEVGKARTQSHRHHRLAPIAHYLLSKIPNLAECLPVPSTASVGFRTTFSAVRGAAGLMNKWAPDVMRHTYVSHAVPLLGADEVARQAGNSVSVINRHYRKPKSADDVADFWLCGLPAGDRLLGSLSRRDAEAWMKTPNAAMHGIPPTSMTLDAFTAAIEALRKDGGSRAETKS